MCCMRDLAEATEVAGCGLRFPDVHDIAWGLGFVISVCILWSSKNHYAKIIHAESAMSVFVCFCPLMSVFVCFKVKLTELYLDK